MRAENQMSRSDLEATWRSWCQEWGWGTRARKSRLVTASPLCLAENITPDLSANQILRRKSIESITSRSNHMKLVPRAGKTVRECLDCLPIHFWGKRSRYAPRKLIGPIRSPQGSFVAPSAGKRGSTSFRFVEKGWQLFEPVTKFIEPRSRNHKITVNTQ